MRSSGGRRRFLLVAGGAVFATSSAGCVGDNDNDDTDDVDPNDDVNGFEIDPGTTIEFEGHIAHWLGLAPASIDGEENPTLILSDGGDYVMEWVNGDGATHNLQIWDDTDTLIDDLTTEDVTAVGEGASLELTASPEMVTYVCQYHRSTQIGELRVE